MYCSTGVSGQLRAELHDTPYLPVKKSLAHARDAWRHAFTSLHTAERNTVVDNESEKDGNIIPTTVLHYTGRPKPPAHLAAFIEDDRLRGKIAIRRGVRGNQLGVREREPLSRLTRTKCEN